MGRVVGWVRLVDSGHPYYVDGPDIPAGAVVLDGPPVLEDPAPVAPPPSAPKGAWVEHAVSLGWSPEEAQRRTKAELVADLSEQDVDTSEGDGTVSTEVPGDDLGPDAPEGGGVEGAARDDDLDGDLDGHGERA